MVERKPVSIVWQVVFMFIPFVWIYAFYRIEKLGLGVVLVVVTLLTSIGVQMVLPFPYGLITAYAVSIGIPISFIIKWSEEWNTSISQN